MSFQPADIAYVDIFPPIGIARVGNSDQFYIGPEVPHSKEVPVGGLKEDNHRIKRQAARFRVYAFDKQNNILGEVNATGGYELTWKANVANTKAFGTWFQQRYAPEPEKRLRNPDITGEDRNKLAVKADGSITGPNASPVKLQGTFKSKGDEIPIYLGELQTDNDGRLVFLGGKGTAVYADDQKTTNPPLPSFANSPGWIDDTCDGPITVTIAHSALQKPVNSKYGAWIVTSPPKFSWAIRCPTSIYDVIEDVYTSDPSSATVDFFRDIWPIFYSASSISWVQEKAQDGHSPGGTYDFLAYKAKLQSPNDPDKYRKNVFKYIRPPVTAPMDVREKAANDKYMPLLSGDTYITTDGAQKRTMIPKQPNTWLSLTTLQYKRLEKWVGGTFQTGDENHWPATFDAISIAEQPAALTLAALEWTIGGAFYPGIEMWWKISSRDTFVINSDNNGFPDGVPPFRINQHPDVVKPGDLTQGMAVPWQADFVNCDDTWWPSARPDFTIPNEPNPSADSQRLRWARGVTSQVTGLDKVSEIVRYGMVKNYSRLPFVVPIPGGEVRMEVGRDPTLPPVNTIDDLDDV